VSDYVSLPQVTKAATIDRTGKNTGNYTISFTAADLPVISQLEIYHMTVNNAPVLATAQILIRNTLFSVVTALLGGFNEWDPSEPALINSGDEIDFLWAVSTSVTPAPQATLWLRYDSTLTRNIGYTP
jgi:hypothetical protein